jgi:hypothetical protein
MGMNEMTYSSLRSRPKSLWAIVAVLSLGCSGTSTADNGGATASTTAGQGAGGEGVGGEGTGGTACDSAVALIVREDTLGRSRVYAKASYRGEDVALLVDTGSQVTFLTTPPGSPDELNYDEVDIGCSTRTVAGRAFSAAEESDAAGLPVVGFLGADYFQESLTRLDFQAARLSRIDRNEIAPDARSLPYADFFGFMFVDVNFDNTPLRLGFDTGAPHSLWIGVDGEPGDAPIETVDGYGNPITLYLGTGILSVSPAPAVEVPLLRILNHKSIEDSNSAIGVDARGLFGLTSIPGRAFVVDAETATIWLE